MENGQYEGSQWSKIRFSKIQDGGPSPSWISILGHSFGFDQYFCTKFYTEMENRQPKWSQCSKIRLWKIQDGGRISILCHNFGVDQLFLRQIWYSDRKSATQRVTVLRNQIFLNCWSERHLVFSVRSIVGSSIQWITNDPKRGRGQGHVTYFWIYGTDTRVPQNVFLVFSVGRIRIENE